VKFTDSRVLGEEPGCVTARQTRRRLTEFARSRFLLRFPRNFPPSRGNIPPNSFAEYSLIGRERKKKEIERERERERERDMPAYR